MNHLNFIHDYFIGQRIGKVSFFFIRHFARQLAVEQPLLKHIRILIKPCDLAIVMLTPRNRLSLAYKTPKSLPLPLQLRGRLK